MKHIQLYIAILFLALLTSCDTFHGCGVIAKVGAPEPKKYINYSGHQYTYIEGFYYPVWVQVESGKRYKIYVSYDTWVRAQHEEVIFCSE